MPHKSNLSCCCNDTIMLLIVLHKAIFFYFVLHLILEFATNELSKKKTTLSLHDYIRLSLQRFRPMIMTTLTTVSGLFPLLFAGGKNTLWQGFAITIIAGLCGTLIIIMIITPIMFDVTRKMCRRRDSNPHGVAPGGF